MTNELNLDSSQSASTVGDALPVDSDFASLELYYGIENSDQSLIPDDFDEVVYIKLNPDVINFPPGAAQHYLQFGKLEGRAYKYSQFENGVALPEDFDGDIYIHLNPDVALSSMTASEHYLRHGYKEGRKYRLSDAEEDISRELNELPADFDEQAYVDMNPSALRSDLSPQAHYMKFGHIEGLPYKRTRPADENRYIRRTYPAFSDPSSYKIHGNKNIDPKLIAFYLPQYHRVKENDEWWGEGFTEWTNVRKATPNFVGHIQPVAPSGGNYYDLSDIKTQLWQIRLAREYGIDAFCYYMYWFNGRRILEKPLDQILTCKEYDAPFCVCWANENWTRTWDGREADILLEQVHSPDSDKDFIRDALKYLADPRYLRIDGRLVLLVYRVDLMKNGFETAAVWRDEVRRAGLGELHLCAIQFYDGLDPTQYGFDAAVEFPPHGWLDRKNLPDKPPALLNPEFSGSIFDYTKAVDFAIRKPIPSYRWYRGVFPSWDNTARRQNTSHIFAYAQPSEFERWLTIALRQQIIMNEESHQVVFINAWNEWGEGAYLEPDEHFGMLKLQAVQSARSKVKGEVEILNILHRLRRRGDYDERFNDEQGLLNFVRGKEQTICRLLDIINNLESSKIN